MNDSNIGDSNIIILMHLYPQTRTEFLRKTFLPGLKPKLRIFAKNNFYTPDKIENIEDLRYFTQLMKYGGVPPQQVLECIPEAWENIHTDTEDQEICTDFMKMYFDCGFIYGPHLERILIHCNNMDFDLFFHIYKQSVKYGNQNAEIIIQEFMVGKRIYSLQNIRYGFWNYQIQNKHISPEKLQLYLTFDLKHFKIDSCFILEILKRGIQNNPKIFITYFKAVLKVPFPQTDIDINKSLKRFFDHMVSEAVFKSQNNLTFKLLIGSLTQFYSYMASTFFKINQQLQMDSNVVVFAEEKKWIDLMIKKLMSNPKDLAFAFLLDNYYIE